MKTKLTTTTLLAAGVWLLPTLAFGDMIGFEGESGYTPAGMAAYRVQSDAGALGGAYIDSDHRSMDEAIRFQEITFVPVLAIRAVEFRTGFGTLTDAFH